MTEINCFNENVSICNYTEVNQPTMADNSNIRQLIYRYLSYAINLVPADAFHEYYEAFRCGDYLKCYKILSELFSPSLLAEKEIMLRMNMLNQAVINSGHCPTHYIFFDIKTSEVFGFPRCCSSSTKSKLQNQVYFFLPKEVLCFDKFLSFSFAFDLNILRQLSGCCEINALYRCFVFRYNLFVQKSMNMHPSARAAEILKLKYFAFCIISLVFPDHDGASSKLDSVSTYLINMFSNEQIDIAHCLSIGLNILNKQD
jgi:hypothetical protein